MIQENNYNASDLVIQGYNAADGSALPQTQQLDFTCNTREEERKETTNWGGKEKEGKEMGMNRRKRKEREGEAVHTSSHATYICTVASSRVTRQFLSNFLRFYYCAIKRTELRKRSVSINCQKA